MGRLALHRASEGFASYAVVGGSVLGCRVAGGGSEL
jgi:hypothetical protein